MYDLPTGNVAAAKKSSPLEPHGLVGQLVIRPGESLRVVVMPVIEPPAAMTIRPSSTFTSPASGKSVFFQPSRLLPSKRTSFFGLAGGLILRGLAETWR